MVCVAVMLCMVDFIRISSKVDLKEIFKLSCILCRIVLEYAYILGGKSS